MPDILIFGMKMPTGEPLRLVLNPNGQLFVDHGVTFTEYEAVELPEHGDLIDRGAIKTIIENHFKNHKIDRYDRELLLHYLDDEMAPVVIPSNKEETE